MPAPSTTWTPLASPATVATSTSTTTAAVPSVSFVEDTFSGETQDSRLTAHVGELGATWSQHPTVNGVAVITSAGRVRHFTGNNGTFYYTSGTPPSADYRVRADITRLSTTPTGIADVLARVNTTADTRYGARYSSVTPGPGWALYKVINGVASGIGVGSGETLTNGTTKQVMLEVSGTTITLYVDGVSTISVRDSGITLAGRAGISIATVAGAVSANAAGLQLDNFVAESIPSVSTATTSVTTVTAIPAWSVPSDPTTSWVKSSGASTAWATL